MNNATALRMKTVASATDMAAGLASIAAPAAAMALPPQIDVPTETSVEAWDSTFSQRPSQ